MHRHHARGGVLVPKQVSGAGYKRSQGGEIDARIHHPQLGGGDADGGTHCGNLIGAATCVAEQHRGDGARRIGIKPDACRNKRGGVAGTRVDVAVGRASVGVGTGNRTRTCLGQSLEGRKSVASLGRHLGKAGARNPKCVCE